MSKRLVRSGMAVNAWLPDRLQVKSIHGVNWEHEEVRRDEPGREGVRYRKKSSLVTADPPFLNLLRQNCDYIATSLISNFMSYHKADISKNKVDEKKQGIPARNENCEYLR